MKSRAGHSPFNKTLDAISKANKTKTILALDFDYRDDVSDLLRDAKSLVKKVSEYVCAVKINYHLLLPLSLVEISSLNAGIAKAGLISIADIKLNDIGNTNRVAIEYLWNCGFSGVIVNPFAGYKGALDTVFDSAEKMKKGVITLAYMSHEGADEGYGLRLENGATVFDEFLRRAVKWKSSGIVIGTTRPEKISRARKILGAEIKILCPGSGAQGGDAAAALRAGADYIIVGRSIVDSADPSESARSYRTTASPANH